MNSSINRTAQDLCSSSVQLRLLTFIPYLLLVGFVAAEEKDVQEPKIETTYKPPRCPLKTLKGDGVQVHYVSSAASCFNLAFTVNPAQMGKLFSNGQKFDSRLTLIVCPFFSFPD